jgi:DNA processing protein
VTDHALAAVALRCAPGVGGRGWLATVHALGSPARALAALAPDVRDAALERATGIVAAMDRLGGRILAVGDDDYPPALRDLGPHAPPVLYALGHLARLHDPGVAIVGTRHATAPGLRAAHRLARACAAGGAVVVSGLARGIDAAAHDGALDGRHGATIAILGTGLDVVYPADHAALQRRIARDGLLLSELPPGQRATRGSFPERNRIIAALAQATVVVEAGEGSGALLTAAAATELQRDVAAVPGSFEAASCHASNRLIRDGASVICDEGDLLVLMRLHAAAVAATRHERDAAPPALDDAERAVWRALDRGALPLDEVVLRAGRTADACLAAVTTLELRGLVRTAAGGALERA